MSQYTANDVSSFADELPLVRSLLALMRLLCDKWQGFMVYSGCYVRPCGDGCLHLVYPGVMFHFSSMFHHCLEVERSTPGSYGLNVSILLG